jgi:hypothetical protein
MNRGFTALPSTGTSRALRDYVWATFTRANCGAIHSAAASAVGFGRSDSAARRNARNDDR